MDKKQLVQHYCNQFRLAGITANMDQLIRQAETDGIGYLDYTLNLFTAEAIRRQNNETAKRIKAAQLPRSCDLSNYDTSTDNGLCSCKMPGP